MRLPVMPPVKPMLAKSVPEVPEGDYLYEPKWDGFRAVVFRHGDEVEVMSRNGRPLGRYSPEVIAAVASLSATRFVADGELLVPCGAAFDFAALLARLHPTARRVAMLA